MLRKKAVVERPRTHPEINEFRRKTLIEGTIRSLAEHGVAGTTVRSICSEANSSRGLMNHYFDSKEHLLEIAFRHLYQTVASHVAKKQTQAGDDPVDQLHALPNAVFSAKVNTPQNRNAFLTFWHEIRFNPLVRKANQQVYGNYLENTERLFAAAAAERGISLDARQAAMGLITMIDGYWLSLSIYEKLSSREEAIACCTNYIDTQLMSPA
ncbi:TetR family transcriptional regulator [Rhodospirillaceae bacterium KN72]|uniref:TetR family transcriptional regulator n=1 Tax=Pacificispira spongiicola TaxID=2729598 RepID=A0A7Y0E1P5_9PROT|nr:TetR family transcriptional regulator C-terminal domain-containing protein [Pacificispira spongiicola]NMM45627.1 TetR family transcriptional regulator [Pacificispira spongiicola]